MRLRYIIIQLKRITQREFNRKYLLFLVFFCVAALFWFINALNKQYNTSINIQVEYANIPPTKAIVNTLPLEIFVDVEASGFALLNYFWQSKHKKIVVNVGKLIENSFEWTQEFRIPTNDGNDILGRFDDDFIIKKVNPDTIVFRFTKVNMKKVPITLHHNLHFEQQYQLRNQIKIIPDSVTIYGAQINLDKIHCVYTEKFEKKSIHTSFSSEIKLLPQVNISCENKTCTIEAQVEKYTEQSFVLPIIPIHVPDSVVIDLMKERVTITAILGLSKVMQCKVSDFKVIADFNKLDKTTGYIPVEIVMSPSFARIIKQEPAKVGYIIDIKE